MIWSSCLLATAALGLGPLATDATAALLPVPLPAQANAQFRQAARAVELTLEQALARHWDHRLLRHDQVEALAAEAAQAQLMGCDQEGCLAQLAEALNVDVIVRTQLGLSAGVWDLRVVMLDRRTASAARRAGTQGRSLDALLLGVDSVARELASGTQLSLEDPLLYQRLGTTVEAAREFKDSAPAGAPLVTAWTDHLVRRNRESGVLAAAEGLLLLMGACGLGFGIVVTAPISVVANTAVFKNAPVQQLRTQPATWGNYTFPLALTVVWAGAVSLTLVLGVLPFLAAGVLALVDLLDLGRVPVARQGCCRDENRIRDAAEGGILHRVAPLIALVAAGVMMLNALLTVTTGVLFGTVLGGDNTTAIARSLGAGVDVDLGVYRAVAAVVMVSAALAASLGSAWLAAVPLAGAVALTGSQHNELVEDTPVRVQALAEPTPRARPAPPPTEPVVQPADDNAAQPPPQPPPVEPPVPAHVDPEDGVQAPPAGARDEPPPGGSLPAQ